MASAPPAGSRWAAAPDEELLAGCLRGEAGAWDALIDRYAGLIYAIPLKYRLSQADAEDVFQAVCATLLEKLDTVRDTRRLPAWLATTTTRQTWTVLRQRGRETPASLAPGRSDGTGVEPADAAPLPDEALLALERQALVRAAVEQLTGPCRTLVEALFGDVGHKRSYQDLAAHLGIPLNSLGPTRARCLARLRRLLEAAGYRP